ncbi:MAG: F0F1 ATP synthase subunit B [Oscillospiraceae bacterium]|nr:F0F1 ATP synthase subunit B [Oscillospiraceae bacterium]
MGNVILLAEKIPLPIFNLEPFTFVLTLCNTLIIVLLYRFLLHKKVGEILDKRNAAIKAEIDEATLAKGKAEAAEKKYLALLADSRAESERILTAANAKARQREDEIVAKAEESATQIRQKAQSDIERERKRAVNEIKDQISGLVIMAASAVAEKEINEQDNAALIESFLVNAEA